MMSAFYAVMISDLKRNLRNLSDATLAPIFFVMIVGFFAMTLPLSPEENRWVGPAIIWVTAALTLVFSLDFQFRKDCEEGGMELLILSVHPLPILLCAKILASLVMIALPVIILSPLLGFLFNLSLKAEWVLFLSLLLGLPSLAWMIMLGLSLLIALQKGGILLSILVLPLIMPNVLLGISAVKAAEIGVSFATEFALLSGLGILSWLFLPMMVASILRVSQE